VRLSQEVFDIPRLRRRSPPLSTCPKADAARSIACPSRLVSCRLFLGRTFVASLMLNFQESIMNAFRTFVTVALALSWSSVATAYDYKLGTLEIDHPWARATPPTAPAGGGYLTITNKGAAADRLVSVKSPAAGAVQVHEMKMEGNVMRMREVEGGLAIAPGATVALAPGGLHLMMMGLKMPLKQGEKVPVTLVFEKAGSIDIELDVMAMGAAPAHEHK
jgi:copper(I)-binding protein